MSGGIHFFNPPRRPRNWSSQPSAITLSTGLTTLVADYGVLTLTGKSATLDVSLAASQGTLTLTGGAATLDVSMASAKGDLLLTGGTAVLTVGTSFDADYGALTLTGGVSGFNFSSDPGTLLLIGRDSDPVYSWAVDYATLTLTGLDATFEVSLPRGHGSSTKKTKKKKVVLRPRKIEVEGEPGKPKKVDYVDHFAPQPPPPPPPPLVLAPDWLDSLSTTAPAPQPVSFDLLGYPDPLAIQDQIDAAEDERDAMALINKIPDEVKEEVQDFLGQIHDAYTKAA